MFKELIISISAYIKSYSFITQKKMLKWIILPGLFYSVILVASIYFFYISNNSFIKWMVLKTGLKTIIEGLNDGVLGYLITMGTFNLSLFFLLFYFSLFKYVFFSFSAPLYLFFQFKFLNKINETNEKYTFTLLKEHIKRVLIVNLRLCIGQSIYLFFLLFISLIPIIGWFMPILTLILESYYIGAIMLNFTFTCQKKSYHDTFQYFTNFKGMCIGNGMIYYLIHFVPIIGWIFAPFYALVASKISIDLFKDDI